MAKLRIEMWSQSLVRYVSFYMYLPNDLRNGENRREDMKTLFFLHGYTGCAGDGGDIAWLADMYNIAIVLPNGENSFYVDGEATGRQFGTFLGIELVDYVRKTFSIALTRETTFIAGISMGGYGAIRTALRYPERFSKGVGLSPGLVNNMLIKQSESDKKSYGGMANDEYYKLIFGDLTKLAESDKHPENLAKGLVDSPIKPDLYICIGRQDFLLETNRDFHNYLDSIGYEHTYVEDAGTHEYPFWAKYQPLAIKWLMDEK